MEETNPKNCRICGSGRLILKWNVGTFHVVKCLDCTAMMVANTPTIQELSEHYSKVSDPAYYDTNRGQLCYYYEKLAAIIRKLRPEGKRIFDVGCSRGWFLGSMAGWECHGNEINEFEAGEARKIAGVHIVQGPFETCPDYEEPFDVVTIQDVLDHFIDPVAVVQKASAMLRTGGLMVIKVHDFDCLWAQITGKKFYAVIPPDHLTYFTRKSLRVLCEKNGFSVIRQAHYSQAITIPTIFFRLSHSNRNSFFGRIHTALENTFLKHVTIRKNLNDIITIFAIKTAETGGIKSPKIST